tara:strand:- start:271 stop:405 length:135 start_codon:yes stop_codon:yes gene_type:complete
MNNNNTYFGAFEVIKKILLGSKYLNIDYLYLNFVLKDYYYEIFI